MAVDIHPLIEDNPAMRVKKIHLPSLLFGLLTVFLSTNCSAQKSNVPIQAGHNRPMGEAKLSAEAPAPAPAPADGTRQQSAPGVLKRLLIYEGEVSLVVVSPDETIDLLKKYASKTGGYIVYASRTRITFRIPAAKFRDGMNHVRTLGEVTDFHEQVVDVTRQFRDLQLRLKSAMAEREKLIQLIGQAKNLKDVLSIRKEIRSLTEEIERIKAQLAEMKELISYSTITVHLRQRSETPVVRPLYGPYRWLETLGLDVLMGGGRQ